jgi:hypothetical protein
VARDAAAPNAGGDQALASEGVGGLALPVVEPHAIGPAPAVDEKPDDGAGEDDRSPPAEVAAVPRRDILVRHLSDVRALLRKGDADGALAGLYRLRRQKPPPTVQRQAEIATLLGHLYYDRKWWTDSLREYRFAVNTWPRAKSDAILVGNSAHMLGDAKTYARARRLLVDYVGRAGLHSLRKLARASSTSPSLRKSVQAVIAAVEGRAGPTAARARSH